MEDISWQSVLVALGILALLSAVTVTAILRFGTVDEVLKIVGAFAGIFGVVTGAFVTYFFSRQPVAELQAQVEQYQKRASDAEQRLALAQSEASSLVTHFATTSDQTSLAKLRSDPEFERYLRSYESSLRSEANASAASSRDDDASETSEASATE